MKASVNRDVGDDNIVTIELEDTTYDKPLLQDTDSLNLNEGMIKWIKKLNQSIKNDGESDKFKLLAEVNTDDYSLNYKSDYSFLGLWAVSAGLAHIMTYNNFVNIPIDELDKGVVTFFGGLGATSTIRNGLSRVYQTMLASSTIDTEDHTGVSSQEGLDNRSCCRPDLAQYSWIKALFAVYGALVATKWGEGDYGSVKSYKLKYPNNEPLSYMIDYGVIEYLFLGCTTLCASSWVYEIKDFIEKVNISRHKRINIPAKVLVALAYVIGMGVVATNSPFIGSLTTVAIAPTLITADSSKNTHNYRLVSRALALMLASLSVKVLPLFPKIISSMRTCCISEEKVNSDLEMIENYESTDLKNQNEATPLQGAVDNTPLQRGVDNTPSSDTVLWLKKKVNSDNNTFLYSDVPLNEKQKRAANAIIKMKDHQQESISSLIDNKTYQLALLVKMKQESGNTQQEQEQEQDKVKDLVPSLYDYVSTGGTKKEHGLNFAFGFVPAILYSLVFHTNAFSENGKQAASLLNPNNPTATQWVQFICSIGIMTPTMVTSLVSLWPCTKSLWYSLKKTGFYNFAKTCSKL